MNNIQFWALKSIKTIKIRPNQYKHYYCCMEDVSCENPILNFNIDNAIAFHYKENIDNFLENNPKLKEKYSAVILEMTTSSNKTPYFMD